MKLIKFLCCLLLSTVLLASVTVYAADSYITFNGFTFYNNSSGDAVIYEYVGNDSNVIIPDTLLGSKVVAIDKYAFFENTTIQSVSFEKAKHLSSIGIDAFYGCTKLKTLNIPASIGTIQYGTFQNCTGLESAVIEDGLTTIDRQAFMGCSSLEYVEIPNSVTSIAANAFKNCNKLVIYCNEGSYAQEYAEQYSIPYLLIREYELGDANLDGTVNIRDVTTIQLFIAGILEKIPEFRGKNYADTTKDGKINIRDATMIQLKLADYIQHF